ncbi:MAG TPA: hypothetical protein VNT75_10125 [Symbiobacteriaceae bacterium]|nr:hypothetical protein [Symbiobacteriaceae bacterium]
MKYDEIAAAIQPLANRSVAAFPGLTVAGDLDDLMSLPNEIAMTEDWLGYLNLRVLATAIEYYGAKPNFVRYVTDPVTMEVIIIHAKDENEYGAQPVKYVETENGAYINLRLPLKQLKINKLPGRVRTFRVTMRSGADGKPYLAFSVKDAKNRPVRTKKGTSSTSKTETKATENKPATKAPEQQAQTKTPEATTEKTESQPQAESK